MANVIEELQTKLKQLKNRLKPISTAQSNFTALKAIKEYFLTVQEYLEIINNNYSSHIEECSSHTTSIQNLQSQINEINIKIENLPRVEDFNLTEMQNQINSLQSNLEVLQESFNTLTKDSDITISQIVSDISTLQTEVGIINDFLFSHTEQIDEINSDIANMQTNISNLTTAQNNLTSTQNTLSTNLANIDTRLSNAEENINTLTGGIDVSELDDRLSALENGDVAINYFSFKEFNYRITPSEKLMYTQEFYFSCDKVCSLQCFDLYYNSNSSGILTVDLCNNKEVVKTINIDLSLNPSHYKIYYYYIPLHKGQSAMLKLSSTTDITYDYLIFSLFGKCVHMYKPIKDVVSYVFNNKIYITKREDSLIKYGKFESVENIDLNNLPNETNLDGDNKGEAYLSKIYIPFPLYSELNFSTVCDAFLQESIDNSMVYKIISPPEDGSTKSDGKQTKKSSTFTNIGYAGDLRGLVVNNGQINYYISVSYLASKPITITQTEFPGDWLFAFGTNRSNSIIGDSAYSYDEIPYVGLYEDGYLYFFKSVISKSYTKLAKGNFATIYARTRDTFNVYITNNSNNIEIYSVTISGNSISSECKEIIPDCDCVYELTDNYILKHIVSSNSWTIESL